MHFLWNINTSGLLVLFAFVAFLLSSHSIDFSFFLTLFLMGGVILRAADRFRGHNAVLDFIFAVFWIGYWCVVAHYAFIYSGFVVVISSIGGHGGVMFWLFLATFLFFACLVVANLVTLFLIPKPESKS